MLRRWWPFLVVAAVWLVVATQQITLPGVYMDAVDPDYLAVRLLNSHAQPITAWLLGGNYLFHRAPILISYYHGSQQVWLGLPFFAVFGTTVTGLRLTHAMFALGILAALHALLVRGGLKPWQAALAGVALAVDPAFSYAFRTQSYITLAPTAWLFIALYALQRATAADAMPRRWLIASGLFYGFAIVGYFIYAFYLPAMLLAVELWRRKIATAPGIRNKLSWWLPWLAGLAVGGIFYPIGYGLTIVDAGSVAKAWAQFQQTQHALGAFSAQIPLSGRIAHAANIIGAVFSNWFHHQLIFGEYAPLPGSVPKIWVLYAVPAALWLLAEFRRRSSVPLRVLVALPIAFVPVAMIFGTRLQGHHYMTLLPVAYATLAVALCANMPDKAAYRRWAQGGIAFLFTALAAVNVQGQFVEARRLAETRGVGLYSDAINRLADDLNAVAAKPFVYFPDWGLSMPIAFLTRGTVGMDSVPNAANARKLLCSGRDVAFAAMNGDRAARIEDWQRDLRWNAPSRATYRQADGKVVFELATFSGERNAPGCQGP